MNERKMPSPAWTFEKKTSLTIPQIESILFNITEGHFQSNLLPFILKDKANFEIKKEDRFIVLFEDGHKEYITVDKEKHQLTIQGEWWYRGVYSFLQEQEQEQTKLRLEIYNVASKFRWVASLMILPEKRRHQTAFDKFVLDLEEEAKKV